MADPDFTIDMKTALSWAKRWRKEEGTYNAHHELHAFLIPKEDIAALAQQEGVDAIRAYIGVDENDVEKLMIVGTTYNKTRESFDDMIPDSQTPGLIYDFTRPCPPACGYHSPLNDIPPTE
jgi:hypothetical protein